MTDVERMIWKELRAHRFGDLKFKRQQPVGNYVVDFVCLEKRVVIELDGGQHAENIAYDSARDNWLKSQGFRVIRFWNNDVLSNRESVLAAIAEACGLESGFNPSPPAPEGLALHSSPALVAGSYASRNPTSAPQGERGE